MIIIITGPTGSGKSSVAKALCQKFDTCVRLDIDRVKHFVESGFIYDESIEGEKQWDLCAKNVVDLTKNFVSEQYTVVIEGVFYEKEWNIVFKGLDIDHKFVLLPHVDETISRDKARDPRWAMGEDGVREHYDEFTRDYYDDFETVDSSGQRVGETVEHIYHSI